VAYDDEIPESFVRTLPVTQQDLDEVKRRRAQLQGFSLLLYHHDGIRVVPLLDGESVVIGRSPAVEVSLRDSSLSWEHARVTMDGGQVWIEDLGSRNGIRVQGEVVERAQALPGAEITFGGVAASVQTLEATGDPTSGLESHDRFKYELEAEVGRARAFGHVLSLLMIRGEQGRAAHVGRWFPKIRKMLRPFDRLALYSTDTSKF